MKQEKTDLAANELTLTITKADFLSALQASCKATHSQIVCNINGNTFRLSGAGVTISELHGELIQSATGLRVSYHLRPCKFWRNCIWGFCTFQALSFMSLAWFVTPDNVTRNNEMQYHCCATLLALLPLLFAAFFMFVCNRLIPLLNTPEKRQMIKLLHDLAAAKS